MDYNYLNSLTYEELKEIESKELDRIEKAEKVRQELIQRILFLQRFKLQGTTSIYCRQKIG